MKEIRIEWGKRGVSYLLGINFQKFTKIFQGYIFVQVTGSKHIMLNNNSLQNLFNLLLAILEQLWVVLNKRWSQFSDALTTHQALFIPKRRKEMVNNSHLCQKFHISRRTFFLGWEILGESDNARPCREKLEGEFFVD